MTGAQQGVLALVLGSVALAASCGLPTDESEALAITFAESEVQLVVGETRPLTWQVSGIPDPGVEQVVFASSDRSVVRVDAAGALLGVARGRAEVTVALGAFEHASGDTLMVSVLPDVALDAVAPVALRYGEVVTAVGSGLDPSYLASVSIGGWVAEVASYSPALVTDTSTRDTLRLYVPPGAVGSSDLVVLHRAGGTASWPVEVQSVDLFEPNNAAPAPVTGPAALTNPALSFDPGDGWDWYRLHGIEDGFTLEVRLRLPYELASGNVTLSSPRAGPELPPEWSIAAGSTSRCNGLRAAHERAFYVDEDATDAVLIIPVFEPASDSLDLLVEMFTPPATPHAYSIRVREGYQTPYPPDAFEPNNHCGQAEVITGGLSGTLTLDASADDDWFRFTVGPEGALLDAAVRCLECEDAYILSLSLFEDVTAGHPDRPDELPRLELDEGGPQVSLSRSLGPGSYFLLVHNEFLRPLAELELEVTLRPNG